MKSGKFLVLMFLSFISLSVFAQQRKGVDITGVVVEEDNTPIEQATIRLLSVKDSTFINGVVSGKDGDFRLKNINPGEYLLHISFIGFDPLYQPLQITGQTNPVNLGKMDLGDGSIMLREAVVVGKAAEMVVRNDTIEYNADSFKVTEGSVLEDLLKKMPGVEIDSEGKIKVNGKEVKKMMVDGKEFFTDDPKVASKNLPANMIDKVQVLDRLSEMSRMTGFDDGNEETIINLTVKPGMKEGWIGNAFVGYGSKDRYEGNAMINRLINNDQFTLMGGLNNTNNMGFSDMASTSFSGMGGGRGGGFGARGGQNGVISSGNGGLNFSKEFNALTTLGGNGRYSHSDGEAISKGYTTNFLSDGTELYEADETYRNSISDNIGTNFRLEWKPDSMTTVLFRPNVSYSKTRLTESGETLGFDNNNDTTYVETSNYHAKGESYNLNGLLEFSRILSSNGRIFSASLGGGYSDTYTNAMNQNITEHVSGRDEVKDQRLRNENSGFNYQAYTSWVEPIGRNNFMQVTYSINQRKQEQLKNAYNQDEDGIYNVIDTTQTQNFRNNYINQRASLSFKSIRAKFNYTIGFNVDPSHSSSERFIGDTVLYKLTQNVVNFSPTAQFRFNFSKQKNLRIDYNGRTSQPSMTQLQPVPDYTSNTNTKIGNPDLKPLYTNNMFVRYQSFNPEKQTTFMVMANANYVVNDIVNYIIYDSENTGYRTTTYDNINGNYNGNVRVTLNTPLKNRKFTVGTMTYAAFSNKKEYTGTQNGEEDLNPTKIKSGSKQTTLSERLSLDFRSSIIDLGVTGNLTFNNINYTKNAIASNQNNDQKTYNYGLGGRTTIYLPANIKLESDINWAKNSGYATGFEQDEVLWNASASINFLKGNQGTLRFKIYDILKQRSNISQTITASREAYTEYNTINSYFMVNFIYRFSAFKGGASMNDVKDDRRGPGEGGGRNRGFGGAGGPPHGRF